MYAAAGRRHIVNQIVEIVDRPYRCRNTEQFCEARIKLPLGRHAIFVRAVDETGFQSTVRFHLVAQYTADTARSGVSFAIYTAKRSKDSAEPVPTK